MPCRVGITTNPIGRKSQWDNKVVRSKKWRIIGKYRSKDKAQAHESRYAKRTGCRSVAGGPSKPGMWYVYRFDYIREK